MKIKNSLLSVCLSILLFFGCFVPSFSVYASSGETDNQNFIERNWNKVVSDVAGFLSDSVQYTRDFLQYLTNHKSDYGIGENEDVNDWVNNNTTVDNNGNVIINDGVINSMRDMINNYITNDTGYIYCYSVSTTQYLHEFSSQSQYEKFVAIINSLEQDYILFTYPRSSQAYSYILCFPKNTQFVYQSNNNTQSYIINLYVDWQSVSYTDYSQLYYWDGSDYVKKTGTSGLSISRYLHALQNTGSSPVLASNLTNVQHNQYILYDSFSSMQNGTTGVQDYYISDSYNTDHITGSYNTTVTDINNSPTYTDVNSYINQYYSTNNYYPSTTQIYNYINNYEPSGGEGGDSGEGEDSAGIWALIQKVLDFISKLFDTVAGFLADLVDSLGDVVNSVINNILNIITTFKDNIPNAIGELLEWFFPFLPSEIVSLIELSILCAVIVGLVRLIRGH